MTKSATDVMQEIIFSAVIDSAVALKAASKGLPNTLLRDLNAIHANTTYADLPKDLQDSISASVRAAFTRLLKEGYSVSQGSPAPRSAIARRDPPSGSPRPRPPAGKRPDADSKRPPPRNGPPKHRPRSGGR